MPDEDDIAFPTPVRSSRNVPRPLVFKTVGEALDYFFVYQNLTEAERAKPHWLDAHGALYEALGPPPRPDKVLAAQQALETALKKEGWHA